ncbi:hypothetical protein [Candidatus Poriferisodalis sp.]|uniref:hypothetical protein n=1 Tax=Candidatus Poriferisodalis sp. TaxID=3101277 RepID=UPI003B58B6FA
MEADPQSKSRTRLKRRSNGDLIISESQGLGVRRLVHVGLHILGAASAASAVTWVASAVNLNTPRVVLIVAWFMFYAALIGFLLPSERVLQVSPDAVTVQLGYRPKHSIPITSIQSAEHVLLRSPGRILVSRTQAADLDRVYGHGHGYAARIHYIDDDFSARSLTFVTSEAKAALDALKRVGVRISGQEGSQR